jgi:hypothetical protein
MASSYSTDLKLELMVTGENAGTWGDNTNENLKLIQQAIAGFESVTITNGGTVALAMSDGALSNARNMVIKFATITLSSASVITIPDGIEKFYIFDITAVTNPSNLTIKTASGTGFSPAESKIVAAYTDGTNLNEIALDTLGGTIGTAQIADNAVTTAKIPDNAILSAKISANQVTTAKIPDNAITTAKISALQVTSAKIANDAVGADQLADTAVTAASYTNASITVDAQGRITAASSGAAAGGDAFDFTLAVAGPGPVSTTYSPLNPASTAGYGYLASGSGNGGQRGVPVRIGGNGGDGTYGFFTFSAPGGLAGTTLNIGGGAGSSQFGNIISIAAGNNGGSQIDPGNPGSITFNLPGGNIPGANTNTVNNSPFDNSADYAPLILLMEGEGTDALGNTYPGAQNGFFLVQGIQGGQGGSPNVPRTDGNPGYFFFYEKNGGGF